MAEIHGYMRLLHDIPADRLQAGDLGEILAIYAISAGSEEMLYCVQFWRRDAAMLDDVFVDVDDAICSVDLHADEFEVASNV